MTPLDALPILQPVKGVAATPPPPSLMDALTKQVAATMASLPAGAKGAIVTVPTKAGVNLALATHINGHVDVSMWIGKTWDAPLDIGGAVAVHW